MRIGQALRILSILLLCFGARRSPTPPRRPQSKNSSMPGSRPTSGRPRRPKGISRKAFDRAFAGVAINWKLPDLVAPGENPKKKKKQSQAEFSSPGPYFAEKRLAALAQAGKAYASSHARLLKSIEKKYGVRGEIVVAIWGRETGYGKAKITSSEIEVLATMAFMGDRKDLFRKELLAALVKWSRTASIRRR